MKFLGPPSSGSIAAVTFSHNRGGQYQKARNGRGGAGMPAVAAAVAAWQGLTPEEQATWASWARNNPRAGKFGPITLSGYQAFTSAYLSQAAAGIVTPGTSPVQESVFRLNAGATTITCFQIAGTGHVEVDCTANRHAGAGDPGFGNKLLLDVSGAAVSSGITYGPGRNGWKHLQTFTLTDTMFVSATTAFTTGQHFFARIREWREDFKFGPALTARLTVP